MKKILSLTLVVLLTLGTLLMICSCNKSADNSKVAGVYEMVDISGTIKVNGQTTQLKEELYDYYRITLNTDGSAKVESKGAGTTAKIEEVAEWELDGNTIKLKSKPQGITVVEEMEWDNGTITYNANQSASGMTVSMTIVLKKK